MFRNLEELSHQIHRFGLEAIEDKLISFARPSVLMERTLIDEDLIPIGASKLGGNPDLPEGFEWPYVGDKPLTFIAQFKLSEVANASQQELEATFPHQMTLWDMNTIPTAPLKHTDTMFPETGMIYFFYDADEVPWGDYAQRDSWRVHYLENERAALNRTIHPTHPGKWKLIAALPSHRIHFYQTISLPFRHSLDIKDEEFLFSDLDDQDQASDWFIDEYREFLWENTPEPRHYLGGYALPIQDKVEWECIRNTQQMHWIKDKFQYSGGQAVKMDIELKRWQFLFQIDYDISLKAIWGDSGTVYVCIPKTSLQKRQFEDCWIIMQCY